LLLRDSRAAMQAQSELGFSGATNFSLSELSTIIHKLIHKHESLIQVLGSR
jgi:hypothetical protein